MRICAALSHFAVGEIDTVRRRIHAWHMRSIHACHMRTRIQTALSNFAVVEIDTVRRRIHACHMRRRIQTALSHFAVGEIITLRLLGEQCGNDFRGPFHEREAARRSFLLLAHRGEDSHALELGG